MKTFQSYQAADIGAKKGLTTTGPGGGAVLFMKADRPLSWIFAIKRLAVESGFTVSGRCTMAGEKKTRKYKNTGSCLRFGDPVKS
jgi:hypothetical protein